MSIWLYSNASRLCVSFECFFPIQCYVHSKLQYFHSIFFPIQCFVLIDVFSLRSFVPVAFFPFDIISHLTICPIRRSLFWRFVSRCFVCWRFVLSAVFTSKFCRWNDFTRLVSTILQRDSLLLTPANRKIVACMTFFGILQHILRSYFYILNEGNSFWPIFL